MKCGHCGHTGRDVVKQNSYVGGNGYVSAPYCQDSIACWKRWDKDNMITDKEDNK